MAIDFVYNTVYAWTNDAHTNALVTLKFVIK